MEEIVVNQVKKFRAQRGLTQAELAEKCDVTRECINHIENGKCGISLRLAMNICKTFGLKIEDVFTIVEVDETET